MEITTMFWFWYHWSLFLRVQLTKSPYWFRWALDTIQVTNDYMKQYWPIICMHHQGDNFNKEMSFQKIPLCWQDDREQCIHKMKWASGFDHLKILPISKFMTDHDVLTTNNSTDLCFINMINGEANIHCPEHLNSSIKLATASETFLP